MKYRYLQNGNGFNHAFIMDRILKVDAEFSNLAFNDKALETGDYENCSFNNCDFSASDLSGINFLECVFTGCNLSLV